MTGASHLWSENGLAGVGDPDRQHATLIQASETHLGQVGVCAPHRPRAKHSGLAKTAPDAKSMDVLLAFQMYSLAGELSGQLRSRREEEAPL